MTFAPVKGHTTYAGWVIDRFDLVSLKSVETAEGTIDYLVVNRGKKTSRQTAHRCIACACVRTRQKQTTVALHEPVLEEPGKNRTQVHYMRLCKYHSNTKGVGK